LRITPRSWIQNSTIGSGASGDPAGTDGYDRDVILASFLVGLAFVIAATIFCVVRGVRLWRQAKTTGSALGAEAARFEERSARTERLLAEAESSSKELEAALQRLRKSRAELQVLLDAVERAKARTRWLRAFLPV
jgi:uncharacterized protein YhaN